MATTMATANIAIGLRTMRHIWNGMAERYLIKTKQSNGTFARFNIIIFTIIAIIVICADVQIAQHASRYVCQCCTHDVWYAIELAVANFIYINTIHIMRIELLLKSHLRIGYNLIRIFVWELLSLRCRCRQQHESRHIRSEFSSGERKRER